MNKQNVTDFVKGVQNTLAKYSPEILTGLGIAGMLTTTVLAVKATPKALRLIDEEKDRQNQENDLDGLPPISKLKPLDMVKVTWKCYIPAVITCVSSTACLIGASSTHAKRNAVLATAYKLSETALAEYREKVIETIGEKKEKTIKEKLHKEHVEQNPASKNEVIITGKGDTLCYDYDTGRYFKSDIEKIKKAVNELNHKMLYEYYISVNDFYEKIGLSGTKTGSRMGWNTDMGLLDLHFSSQLSDDGTPCLVIEFNNPPKYNFDRFC